MGLLDDVMADDARYAYTDSDVFGEAVTYKPYNASTRSITASVHRMGRTPIPGTPQFSEECEVFIPYSATTTVGITTVNVGGDKISFPAQPGGTARDWQVVGIAQQDKGGWLLKVR